MPRLPLEDADDPSYRAWLQYLDTDIGSTNMRHLANESDVANVRDIARRVFMDALSEAPRIQKAMAVQAAMFNPCKEVALPMGMPSGGYVFPNRPVVPQKERVFDDRELAQKMHSNDGVSGE